MDFPYQIEFDALRAKFEALDAQVTNSPRAQSVTNGEMISQSDTLGADIQELKTSLGELSAKNTDMITQLEERIVSNTQKIAESVEEQNARHTEMMGLVLQLREEIRQLKQGTVNQGYSASPSHSRIIEPTLSDVSPMEIIEAEQLPQVKSGKTFWWHSRMVYSGIYQIQVSNPER